MEQRSSTKLPQSFQYSIELMYSLNEDVVKHVSLLKHHVKENNHSETISQMFQYKTNVKGSLPLHKIHILFVHHNLQDHDLQ